jgi:regulator of cell morphogenesis and NO signaling
MSDLIEADYRLLLLLNRLEIPLGFGEMSIEAVCRKYDFDPDCFLFIANLQSNKPVYDYLEAFQKLPLESMLNYLQKSHSYFLDRRLPRIRKALETVIVSLDENIQKIILRFFDDYSNEVKEHMEYENDTAFPYIYSLLGLTSGQKYTIADFEDHHSDIEGKMSDLSRILTKYIQGVVDSMGMTGVLLDLYMLHEELDAHTFIEDQLVIPRVKSIEKVKH